MASAAEAGGRNPDIARGMVDSKTTVSIPEMNFNKENGQIISLTSEEALEVGLCGSHRVFRTRSYPVDGLQHG